MVIDIDDENEIADRRRLILHSAPGWSWRCNGCMRP